MMLGAGFDKYVKKNCSIDKNEFSYFTESNRQLFHNHDNGVKHVRLLYNQGLLSIFSGSQELKISLNDVK